MKITTKGWKDPMFRVLIYILIVIILIVTEEYARYRGWIW